ncbi:MAG: imidazolonepropionase [Nitrososphaerales archaeon]|nr:imidazolonepropionase [Nitrososphaerales archaeon]
MKPDLVLVNAGELVTLGANDESSLGIIEGGAMVVRGGRVVWTGTTKELRRKTFARARKTVDAAGMLVTPGFVDPHTHLVFAGSREDELERKIRGESYVSILNAGGGIVRTVKETRKASLAKLVAEAQGRLRQLVRNGVTTVEVKTGYGQDLRSETKLLNVVKRLSRTEKVELVPTFMGLHAKPPEFGSAKEYVDYVLDVMLPAAARLKPAFADCFCEEGVFTRDECSRYLRASKALGLKLKIHADEFADSKGASLAAETGCVSADHLGNSEQSGVEMMARRGVVAVLLPGTSLYSGIGYADARMIAGAGCRIALGTDLSPNSWVESPQMVMALACNAMKMTPADALRGFTVNAAKALGRDDLGRLVPGAPADFVVHELPGYRFLPYRVGGGYVSTVFKGGVEVYASAPN